MKPIGFLYVIFAILLGLLVTPALSEKGLDSGLKSEPIADTRKEKSGTTSKNQSAQKQQNPDDLTPALKRIEGAIRDLKPKPNKKERERQNHHEISDLNAQQDMALWAKAMSWSTFATVVITFVALILLWHTLIHTRIASEAAKEMVREARKTTDAAIRTNNVTREIGSAQLRAYVGIIKISITHTDGEWHPNIILRFKNSGQTPAYNLTNRMSIEISPADGGFLGNDPTNPDRKMIDLGASEGMMAISLIPRMMWNEKKPKLTDKSNILYVFGEITYDDAFGESHFTRYRSQMRVDDRGINDDAMFEVCPEGNQSD